MIRQPRWSGRWTLGRELMLREVGGRSRSVVFFGFLQKTFLVHALISFAIVPNYFGIIVRCLGPAFRPRVGIQRHSDDLRANFKEMKLLVDNFWTICCITRITDPIHPSDDSSATSLEE